MTDGGVRVEMRGPILLITLDRPDKRNAIDAAMTAALDAAMDLLAAEPDLRAAVLAADGPVFCAGTDLVVGAGGPTPAGGEYGVARRARSKPLVAAVDGPALGGGAELVLACDLVVASRSATFALPEATRGRVARAGGLFRAADRVPRNVAVEMLLTGNALSAERAHQLGLVNRLVDPGAVVPVAVELARATMRSAPPASSAVLAALAEVDRDGEERGWAATASAVDTVRASSDWTEGSRAFAEKRAPAWVHTEPSPAGSPVRAQRRGRSIAMSGDELDAFLDEHRVCRVATVGGDGRPHVAPLWFVWDGTAIWLNSTTRSQRWRDIERDPRVAVVVDAGAGYADLRGVELSGRATVASEVPRSDRPDPLLASIERTYAARYDGFRPDGRHAWLRLVPDRVVSWDFRKSSELGRRNRQTTEEETTEENKEERHG